MYLVLSLSAVPACRAAFEPVFQSPWLQGGVASTLFPRSPLALRHNPVSLGLLESGGVAVSACRPFGLRRLDRTAAAGALLTGDWAAGGMISVSGDGSYAETTADIAVSWRLVPGMAAGAGLCACNLQMGGYGRATGAAMNLAVAWSPVPGVYSTGILRSLLRTGLGDSGDPAAPRSLEFAAGIVPSGEIALAIGVARQEGLDMDVSFHTSFSPADLLSLSSGIVTDPLRFWAAAEVSLASLGLQYGYGEHSSLPSTHSVSVAWGGCAFQPEPLDLFPGEGSGEEAVIFPLNVNEATTEQLRMIPGIGPAKASAVVSWIRMNGPVASIDELLEVPGIGPSLLEVMSEYLTAE
ncbi:MAG: hypothetical protein AVO35_06375 [Candidatus Aegiribacteria sp. MLS_C]|nr:MAG: hypothetical protein AVO35_06375 [Candidatus Aegiribacteria sp. MLS_C]